ncbi:MAG: CHAT domain-containing protein, partial [Caldilineaceae bacterium]|nr:CHAT domain-containing protein [Caldilineaceae bacterium]
AGDDYRVQVIASPDGEASGTFRLPPAIVAQKETLHLVGGAIRAFKLVGASSSSTRLLEPKQFGEALFSALFSGAIGECLRQSLALVAHQGKGLRLRFRLDEAPELAALPWEYLYDPVQQQYLVLTHQTPIVRYLALPQAENPLSVEGPLRILVLTADAVDYARLNIAAEERRLRTALQELETQGRVEITWLANGTLTDLRRALRREEYHILHFIGHGWFAEESGYVDNGLLVVDEMGRGVKASAEILGMNLHNHHALRLVFLNACEGARLAAEESEPFGGVAQHLVQQGIPAAIAMQFPVSDRAAIELTRAFFTALAAGAPIDSALTSARLAIYAQESVMEWGTPVLFLRSASGQLWSTGTQL